MYRAKKFFLYKKKKKKNHFLGVIMSLFLVAMTIIKCSRKNSFLFGCYSASGENGIWIYIYIYIYIIQGNID